MVAKVVPTKKSPRVSRNFGWTLEMNENELSSNDGGFWCQRVPTRIPSFDARSYGNGSCYEMTLGPHSPFSIGYLDNIAPEDSGEEEAPDVFPERLATKVMKKKLWWYMDSGHWWVAYSTLFNMVMFNSYRLPEGISWLSDPISSVDEKRCYRASCSGCSKV